jgi:hypothetical protein
MTILSTYDLMILPVGASDKDRQPWPEVLFMFWTCCLPHTANRCTLFWEATKLAIGVLLKTSWLRRWDRPNKQDLLIKCKWYVQEHNWSDLLILSPHEKVAAIPLGKNLSSPSPLAKMLGQWGPQFTWVMLNVRAYSLMFRISWNLTVSTGPTELSNLRTSYKAKRMSLHSVSRTWSHSHTSRQYYPTLWWICYIFLSLALVNRPVWFPS